MEYTVLNSIIKMFIEIRVNHVLGQEPNLLLSCQFFFSSCLISTKIWFDGLKGLKQHTVISQFSSSRQNFYQTLRRHGSRSTPKELSSSSWLLLASPPFFFYFLFFLICSEFCHTLKWNVLEFTCLPHPDPPSHLPLHPLPPPFITFCLLLLVTPGAKCKIGLVLTTVSESECKRASAQSLLAIASYVTAGCVVYAFP